MSARGKKGPYFCEVGIEMSEQVQFWLKCWENNKRSWELAAVHPMLLKHSDRLLGSSPKRVFFPLSGKSLDMKWLLDQGHTVIENDVSSICVNNFFEEHDIPYNVKDMASVPGGKAYISDDKKCVFYCCDMFDMDPKKEPDFGAIDAVWDRASLITFPSEYWPKYMNVMNKMFRPQTTYLLETVDKEPAPQPPYYISEEDIQNTFGKNVEIEFLEHIGLSALTFPPDSPSHDEIRGFFYYFLTFPQS